MQFFSPFLTAILASFIFSTYARPWESKKTPCTTSTISSPPPSTPTNPSSGSVCQNSEVQALLQFANSFPPFSDDLAKELCSFARQLDSQFCPTIKASTETVTKTTTATSFITDFTTTGTETTTTYLRRRNAQTMGQLFNGKWKGAPPPPLWNQCPLQTACDFCRCLDGELTQSTTEIITATSTVTQTATTTVDTAAEATKTCPPGSLAKPSPLPKTLQCSSSKSYFSLRYVTCDTQVSDDNGQFVAANQDETTFQAITTRQQGIFYLDSQGQLHAVDTKTGEDIGGVLSVVTNQGKAPSFTAEGTSAPSQVYYVGFPLESAAGATAFEGCSVSSGKFVCPSASSGVLAGTFTAYEPSTFDPLYIVRATSGAPYYITDAVFDVLNLC